MNRKPLRAPSGPGAPRRIDVLDGDGSEDWMLRYLAAAAGLAVIVAALFFATPFLVPGEVAPAPGYQGVRFLSETAQAGHETFRDNCASCHGYGGEGTADGPPLITAEMSGDFRDRPAFHRAVERGVAAHRGLLAGTGEAGFNDVELMAKFLREVRQREARNR